MPMLHSYDIDDLIHTLLTFNHHREPVTDCLMKCFKNNERQTDGFPNHVGPLIISEEQP
jgi:hypothetical protein